MSIIKDIFRELFGLFVDDGSLAIAILVWVAFAAFIHSQVWLSFEFQEVIWVLGVFAILLENVLRKARRQRTKVQSMMNSRAE